MTPFPTTSWTIRIVLLMHLSAVGLGGLWCRHYLHPVDEMVPVSFANFCLLVDVTLLFLCPISILFLAIRSPSRATSYAIVAELLLIYASAIALLPSVQ